MIGHELYCNFPQHTNLQWKRGPPKADYLALLKFGSESGRVGWLWEEM